MQLNEYAELAKRSAIYPDAGLGTSAAISYAMLGLCGETGELANAWKKILRKPNASFDELHLARAKMIEELGGVLWYLSAVIEELRIGSLESIARENLELLIKRKANNTISNFTHNQQEN